MTHRERAVLVGILTVVALVLRVGYIHQTHVIEPLRGDAGQYDRYARNLVDHGVFSLADDPERIAPDAHRGPGYPAFLAVAYAASGDGYLRVALYLQALLSALLVPLVYWLGRRFLPPWGATLAAVLTAASPHLVTTSGYLLSETLLCVTLLSALAAWLCGQRRGSARLRLLSGALFGMAGLIHESTVPLLPLLIVLGTRRHGRSSWVALLPFVALLGAWHVRTAATVELPELRAERRALATLSHGTYPGFEFNDVVYRYPYKVDPEQPEFGSSWQRFFEVFGERFAGRPLRYLSWYLLEKPMWLWSWSFHQGQGDVYIYEVSKSLYDEPFPVGWTKSLMRLLHPAILLLALSGAIAIVWRRRRRQPVPAEVVVLLAVLASHTALFTVFPPFPRYSVPLRPELYLCASWVVVGLARIVTRRIEAEQPGQEIEGLQRIEADASVDDADRPAELEEPAVP